MNLTEIITLITQITVIGGVIIPVIVWITRLTNGIKCQLRSEMLRTYYNNKENENIRQYEYENFLLLYSAYKALHGNSFIDRVYDEMKTWDILS